MSKFESEEKPTVNDIANYAKRNKFHLKLLTPTVDLAHELTHNEINRPGLSLVGFYEHFAHSRVQVFGRGEFACLENMKKQQQLLPLRKFFDYDIPVMIFSHGNLPPQEFLKMAEEKGIPIFTSTLSTASLSERLYEFFDKSFSLKETVAGVMMEIFGLGVLISGEKGIGKSECALELIERGHRFIADEIVEVSRSRGDLLTAKSSSLISKHMSLRGIGIINVAHLFGVRSILKQTSIDLCIDLCICLDENGKQNEKKTIGDKQVDRARGLTKHSTSPSETRTILDYPVPLVTLPILVYSNKPVLIETAVMNHSLKMTGYDTTEEFNKKILKATLLQKKIKSR